MASSFDPADVSVWLINSGDPYEIAWNFVDGAGIDTPCLLDADGTLVQQYAVDGGYAPFPRHVVVDRDGVITYVAAQYDASALLQAIQAAVDG